VQVIVVHTIYCDSEHATAAAVAAASTDTSAASTATTAAATGITLIMHSAHGHTDTNYDGMKLVISISGT
jgi:hypothetical protein